MKKGGPTVRTVKAVRFASMENRGLVVRTARRANSRNKYGFILWSTRPQLVFVPRGNFRIKRNGQQTRMCIKCLDASKASRERNRCPHLRRRGQCKDCKGSQICKHERRRAYCKECGECKGSQYCHHQRLGYQCKECKGSQICDHGKLRSTCPIHDPAGHLTHVIRSRTHKALQGNKELSSREYLGCDIATLQGHVEAQFSEGMTWDNHGE
ncbi:uncharacterized protein LOC130642302 [Hydractinia symbiolongicarpus]|uniref:uncharacterized protein LOC130642302 n=1 Tax=Hydractinia symbiolongicarpus TaxID=13093 RepID=UPI00254B9DE4|nr:uncharacterized protein LOC130642302 [Hydractinia symbiolongicarpus]